jgi:hypothetical protein
MKISDSSAARILETNFNVNIVLMKEMIVKVFNYHLEMETRQFSYSKKPEFDMRRRNLIIVCNHYPKLVYDN